MCTPYFLPLFLRPFYLLPSIYAPFSSLFTYTLYSYLYLYAFTLTPSLPTPSTLPSICTHNMYTFFLKNFSKKNRYTQSVPKNFPKIFTYYNYSSPLLFNRKVNSSYSFYKILNTKFWRFYETIKTNEKNYYDFRGAKNPLLSECILSRLLVSFGIPVGMEAEAYLARVRRFS